MAERKGKKLRRIGPDSKVYYKLQFGRTDDNKKRKLRKRVKDHPNDLQAAKLWKEKYG